MPTTKAHVAKALPHRKTAPDRTACSLLFCIVGIHVSVPNRQRACSLHLQGCPLFLKYPEDGGRKCDQKFGTYTQIHVVYYPRRLKSSVFNSV